MKKYLKYVLILAILGGGYGYYMYNKPHQNMKKAVAEMQLTANQLFTDFENNETESNGKYNGKVLEISGVVKEVQMDESGLTTVTLESGSDMFGVSCQLDNLTDHERTKFKEGEKVKLKGICSGMLMDVVLVRCVEV